MSYIYDLTDTWNAGGTTFYGIKMNVTDSASASGSKLISMQIGGSEQFSVSKAGVGYFAGNLGVGTTSPLSVAGYKTLSINDTSGGALALYVNGTIAGSIASFSNDIYYDSVDATIWRNGAAFNGAPTERMRLDGSGNLGIGTSSPNARLDVQQASSGGITAINLTNTATANTSNTSRIRFGTSFDYIGYETLAPYVGGYMENAGTLASGLTFGTYTGGSLLERMRIDASGNVGIGTTNPGWKLEVVGSGTDKLRLFNTAGNGNIIDFLDAGWQSQIEGRAGDLLFKTGGSTERARIDSSGNFVLGTTASGYSTSGRVTTYVNGSSSSLMGFGIGGSNAGYLGAFASSVELAAEGARSLLFTTNGSERARIDSSGNLLVGKTTSSGGVVGAELRSDGTVFSTLAASTNATSTLNVYSTGAAAYRFYVDMAGTINATNATISAISDIRLKENVRDLDAGLDTILALKPRRFDWKEGKGKDVKDDMGFIAQEVEEVLPALIGGWKAGEGEPDDLKSVKAGDLIPVLVKAIQELTARVAQLEGN